MTLGTTWAPTPCRAQKYRGIVPSILKLQHADSLARWFFDCDRTAARFSCCTQGAVKLPGSRGQVSRRASGVEICASNAGWAGLSVYALPDTQNLKHWNQKKHLIERKLNGLEAEAPAKARQFGSPALLTPNRTFSFFNRRLR